MKKNLFLRTRFNCLVKIFDKEWELVPYRLKRLEIEGEEDKIRVLIYPLGNALIPYAFVLDLKKMTATSENVEIVDVYGDILVELLPMIMPRQSIMPNRTKKMVVAGVQHTINYCTLSPFYCKIENGERFAQITHDRIVYTFDYVVGQSKIMVYAKTDDGYIVGLVDVESYKVEFVKEVMLLERDVSKITTLTNMYDCHHHGLVERYDISSDFSSTKDIVYIDGRGVESPEKEMVPYVFMDAIYCEDYALARRYLSPELSAKLDKEHLRAFFGSFEKIDGAINENRDYSLMAIYCENGKKYAKVYYFDIDDDCKITNISEK